MALLVFQYNQVMKRFEIQLDAFFDQFIGDLSISINEE